MAYASTSSLTGTVLKMVKKTMIFVTFLPPYNLSWRIQNLLCAPNQLTVMFIPYSQ